MSLFLNKILASKINKKIFSLGKEVYIVGGYLRDLLSGKSGNDIDYVVSGEIRAFAKDFYNAIKLNPAQASIIELKKDRMIRIVLKDKTTIDFTELKGRLEDNLAERDFTMNSLAWSPETGLIDLFNGSNDIKKKKIRAIRAKNFVNDPLRLLRAYRFAAELGWSIDEQTRKTLKKLSCHLKNPAPERITTDFFKLLDSKNYAPALKLALRDNILKRFLSISNKKLSKNIAALSKIELALKNIPEKTRKTLKETYSQGLSFNGLLKLEHILADSKLNRNNLCLSRDIYERLKTVHYLMGKTDRQDILSKDNLFDTFSKAKDASFDFLIISDRHSHIIKIERFKKIWAN
jgi:tRNA nucleotidyltransferase/poly(A) polymerase